jgi:gas vesicle protein
MDTYTETSDSQADAGATSALAFVIGAAVGAAAALILAPTSGRDTRAYLKRRGNELGRDAAERGRDAWRSQSERVKSAVATGWDRAADAVGHMREHGEAAYREAKDSLQSSDPGVMRTNYPRSSE